MISTFYLLVILMLIDIKDIWYVNLTKRYFVLNIYSLFYILCVATSESVLSDMCAQWRFRSVCAVWPESSMGALWTDKNAKFLHADNKDSDQTAQMRRLIWVFVGCTCRTVHFLTLKLIYFFIITRYNVNWKSNRQNRLKRNSSIFRRGNSFKKKSSSLL